MKEQLSKALGQVTLIPMRECEEHETAVLLGAVGLELYAFYSKLVQLEVEFGHAQEYLDSGRLTDVEETMQINGRTFADMRCKLEKRGGELSKPEKKDREFREPVGAWLKALAEEVKCLEEYRLDANAAENVKEYLEQMRGVIGALRKYLRLGIGNTSVCGEV